ncbi:NDP-hexose 2,3-dehydratase family protein [Streptomyces sp. NPDC096153]|uniref:NDP-hexose 2,3-dehydratase family protein n=1 Tax=Streptomyces sp. NPDC096153 TaxID=3155548 RepID=UPI00331B60C4
MSVTSTRATPAGPRPAQRGDGPERRFTLSALADCGRVMTDTQFHAWLGEMGRREASHVERIAFKELDQWSFDDATGNLGHDSGRFFTVEGVTAHTGSPAHGVWRQPVIHQPEIGILGILVKEFDGVLHCLMQVKMEPGNINRLQLSPTVQATRSNFTTVHRGKTPLYLDHFTRPGGSTVLVDVLQSEQGSWFFHKRNRNMVVEVTGDLPVHEGFCWLTLGQLRRLLAVPDLVNMDSRSVLSCIRFTEPYGLGDLPGATALQAALRRSLAPGDAGALHTTVSLASRINDTRLRHPLTARRLPLAEVPDWHRSADEIAREDGRFFRIVAVSVHSGNREVSSWTQPLLEPNGVGVVAFLARRIDGVLHVLLRTTVEPGCRDTAELGPTVQANPHDRLASDPPDEDPPYLRYVLDAPRERIHYDVVQSEEGGRFHHARNRYVVVEVDDAFPAEVPPDFQWATLGQLMELHQHNGYVNMQARSLVACMHSLW